jgi:hypothetical protein
MRRGSIEMAKANTDIRLVENGINEDGTPKLQMVIDNPEKYTIDRLEDKQRRKGYYNKQINYGNFSVISGGFSFMPVESLKALHQDNRFNDMEKARIIFLGTYVSYEDKGSYLMTNNNRHLLKSNMQELLEISNNKEFYKFFNMLIDAEIIQEEIISRYEVRLKWNSQYHFKGKAGRTTTGSTETVKAYDKQIQALYKEKNDMGKSINTPKNLYILFMVLPFINTESGVLCHQQHNPVEEDCQPLELDELREMFGYERVTTLKNKLLNCKLYGTNVFFIGEGTLDRKKYTRIFVSPYVASRSGNKAPNESLLAMFPNTGKAIIQKLQEMRKK